MCSLPYLKVAILHRCVFTEPLTGSRTCLCCYTAECVYSCSQPVGAREVLHCSLTKKCNVVLLFALWVCYITDLTSKTYLYYAHMSEISHWVMNSIKVSKKISDRQVYFLHLLCRFYRSFLLPCVFFSPGSLTNSLYCCFESSEV